MSTALLSLARQLALPGLLLLSVPTLGRTVSREGAVHRPDVAARPLDPAAKVDFTVSGGGHANERVQLRDVYQDVPRPFARFYASGVAFGEEGPLLELRTEKLGAKLWTIHLVLKRGEGAMPVASSQPALIYNGDDGPNQQAWYPLVVLPPLKQGTLTATLTSGAPSGRVRGTFAGTLVDDKGDEVTITNGSFDLARLPDVE